MEEAHISQLTLVVDIAHRNVLEDVFEISRSRTVELLKHA